MDKYAPKRLEDVVGHDSVIGTLRAWLRGWATKAPAQRAALLSGPPGIGKSTVAALLAAECGYSVVELNASDERSAGSVRARLGAALSTFSVLDRSALSRRLIIMDEVDGMSAGDRGGGAELAKLIPTSLVPILAICNERHDAKVRPLARVCLDARFARPPRPTIAKALLKVCAAEGGALAAVSLQALEALVEASGNDIRSVLNTLQMWCGHRQAEGKDPLLRVDAFAAAGRLLRGSGADAPLEGGMALAFVDHDMVPLMVAEAYVASAPRGAGGLDAVVKAADAITFGDVLARRTRRDGAWALLPSVVAATVAAATAVRGGSVPFNLFPAVLGKTSSKTKRQGLLRDLCAHTNPLTGVSTGRLRTEGYLEVLRGSIEQPLRANDVAGAVNAALALHLTREDVADSLCDALALPLPEDEGSALQGKLKAAFTREFNRRRRPAAPNRSSGVVRAREEEEEASEGEDDGDE